MPQHIHMAGIIPVAGLETNFNQQLPEVMMQALLLFKSQFMSVRWLDVKRYGLSPTMI
mgnify:CR=1 FL=1